jgi:zinc protease
MNRVLGFLPVVLGLPLMASAGGLFPYPYQKETLSNGLTVIMIPVPSPGLIAYYSIVRTGSRDEVEPGKSGFAHFFEHMMFRGTKKYPGPVYDRIVTGLGADANAFTTDDFTAYHLEFAKEDLEKVIDIESDRFQNLDYEPSAFQTEAGAVYGEYRKSASDPFFLLDEKLRNLAYDAHTYKHTTMGFEADIKAMPQAYQYSRSFFQRFYRPENVVLLIVGDVDTKATMDLVKKYYAPWKKGYQAPAIVREPAQKAERSGEIAYPGQTLPILTIAYKGDAFDPANADYVAALALGDLAFGKTSDLYKKLVVQEQKVEFIAADIPMNRDMPLFQIVAMVKKPEDIGYVRGEVYRTLETFKTRPANAARLETVKRHNKYAFLMELDSPGGVAGALARLVALTGGIDAVERLYAALDRVTPDHVQNAAKKYFTADRRTVMVLRSAGEK